MSPIGENNFEDEWKKALADAEADPSPIVWDNIQKGLGSGTPWWKKAILPAVLLLFIGTGGTYFYWGLTSSQSDKTRWRSSASPKALDSAQIQKNPLRVETQDTPQTFSTLKPNESQEASLLGQGHSLDLATISLSQSFPQTSNPNTSDKIPGPKTQNNSEKNPLSQKDNAVSPPLESPRNIARQNPKPAIPKTKMRGEHGPAQEKKQLAPIASSKPSSKKPHLKDLAPLAKYSTEVSYTPLGLISRLKPKTLALSPLKPKAKTWVQIGFTSLWNASSLQANYQSYIGSYLNAHNLSSVEYDNFFEALDEENESPQTWGFKVEVGREIGSRWVIKTGLQYFRQESSITTNAAFINPENQAMHSFWEEIQADNLENPAFAELIRNLPGYVPGRAMPIYLEQFNGDRSMRLKTETQFLSIPVQVGYLLNPKGRLQYTVFGGLAADIFLKNRTRNESTGVELSSQGGNSIYRPINWTASLGLEMHYRLNSQLSIFLEPSYRQALRSYTRNGTFLNNPSQNLGLTLGTRFSF